MRYGVISDVHSNLPALEAVLEALAEDGVDGYLCLGDVVGYGPFPNECCERLRELNCVFVRGNHDESAVKPGKEMWFTSAARACILWTREVLTDDNAAFLASLEPRYEAEFFVLCHGSIPDQDFYTTTPREAMISFRVLNRPLGLFGHTHCAEWFELQPEQQELPTQHPAPNGGALHMRDGIFYLVNPGGTGQPRDHNSCAAYAVLDLDQRRIDLKRVPYNIARTQQAIVAAGLPKAMAARLSVGI
ncbi:MAG: metallophosphoesterase [Armatimonadota bacterium]